MANWWEDPSIQPPPQRKSGAWENFMSYVMDQAGRGVADIPGYLGDAVLNPVRDLADIPQQVGEIGRGLTGNSTQADKEAVRQRFRKPGIVSGPINQKIEETYPEPEAPSRAAKYAGAGARGVSSMGPFLGEGLPAVISGLGMGVGQEAGHEAFPNSEVAPIIGGLVGGAAGAIRPGRGRVIRAGAARENYPDLINTIVDLEGGGSLDHPNTSPKGAKGPMQVMDATARKPGFGIRPWNGKTEADRARVGRQYAAALNDRYDGDTAKVLAAYNAGPGAVDKAVKLHGDQWFQHLPNETKAYLKNGLDKLDKGGNGSTGGPVRPMDPRDIASAMGDNESNVNNIVDFPNERTRVERRMAQLDDDYNAGLISGSEYDKQTRELERSQVSTSEQKQMDTFNEEPQFAQPKDVLTPAEAQDFDASVPTIPVDNTGYEKFTPNVGKPKTPANVEKRTFGQAFKDMMKDDSGTLNVGDGKEPPKGPEDPEAKLLKAIKEAKPVTEEQKALYSKARSERAARLAKAQARGARLTEQTAELKGALPKADYQSVSHLFTPEDTKALEDKIIFNSHLMPFEKLNTLSALHKLVAPEGLSVPTESELNLLADVFNKEIIGAVLDKTKGGLTNSEKIANIGGIPRTIMSSADISAPMRQGLLFIHRKEFWKNYPKMLKMFFNKKFYDTQMEGIKSRPNYGLMRYGHLAVRDSPLLRDREEYFVSNMAENMPGENIPGIGLGVKGYNKTVGALVRASDRAYTGFLRNLRADVFDTLVEQGKKAGVDWTDGKRVKALANFINTATGRGDLGKFEQASQAFSTIFFAPRLIKARADILNPLYYAKLYKADPFIAKEAIKSVAALTAIAGTVLALAAAGGAQVEGDLRSADGLKIKLRNTRVDILGGFQQYLRLIDQLATGTTKTEKGNIRSLTKRKYGSQTRWDVLMNFGANKLAPIPGFGRDFMRNSAPGGEKFTWSKEFADMFTPMAIGDTIDSIKENGSKGAWAALPSILGVGVQTYKPHQSKSKKKSSDNWWDDPSLNSSSSRKKDWWEQ
jgi:hypothetical protein